LTHNETKEEATMKTLKGNVWVVLVTGLSLLTVMLLTHSPRTVTSDANRPAEVNEQSQEAEPNEPVVDQPAPLATTPVRKLASVTPPTPDKTDVPAADIAAQPSSVMRIRADQVLAKINDRAILLAHLVPLAPDEQERAMTAEEYESRLNRAIEMELTFQAAAARGVGLTLQQSKRLGSIARKHEAAFQAYSQQGITWSSLTAAQLEFEQRVTAARMLQQNLVAKEFAATPSPKAELQAQYEAARQASFVRLKSNAVISRS
jgi:hypothetical protein